MFKELRWREDKKQCIRCDNNVIYTLNTGRLRCKGCGLTFGDFTGTYLGQLNIPVNDIAHLLYLFSLGLPIYRCRHYLTISMKTAHKAYTIFRRAIYDRAVRAFTDLLNAKSEFSGLIRSRLSLDFDKPWEGDKRFVYFGITVMDGAVYTFPVTPEEKAKCVTENKNVYRISAMYCTDLGFCIGELPLSGSHLVVTRTAPSKSDLKFNKKIHRFWAFLIEQLHNYHGIDVLHYHLYIKEIEYRFNNRTKDLFNPIAKMLVQPVMNNQFARSPG